jgi:hypothetical protein
MSVECTQEERQLTNDDRGQLVLVAALALAVGLVALSVASLQLGYHEDIEAPSQDPPGQLYSALDRAVHNETAEIPATYDWSERDQAVATIEGNLSETIQRLETSRLADGHAYRIERNATDATRWAADNCPTGPNRQFGRCTARNGIVLQDRNGATHVLAIAFDIEITTPEGTTNGTIRIERNAS